MRSMIFLCRAILCITNSHYVELWLIAKIDQCVVIQCSMSTAAFYCRIRLGWVAFAPCVLGAL